MKTKYHFKTKEFIHELRHHLPFTIFATLSALALLLLSMYLFQTNISETAFEVTHLLHILVSSMVTAGIFFTYRKNVFQAVVVGIIGAILIGSLSDIIFPFLAGTLVGAQLHFHLPLIEMPLLVILTTIAGSLLGIQFNLTKIPHFIHVFLSVFASLFYLLVFTTNFALGYLLISFIIVLFAVIVPCCVSDILFPFFFLGDKIKHCACKIKK
jgi:hypothetical protein